MTEKFTGELSTLLNWIVVLVSTNILIALVTIPLTFSLFFISWNSTNVFWFLLLSIGLGPALTAAAKVLTRYLIDKNDERNVFALYKQGLKESWKTSLKLGVITSLILMLLFYNLHLLLANNILEWLFIPTVILMFMVVYMFLMACILLANFELSIGGLIRNTIVLFFKYPFRSVRGLLILLGYLLLLYKVSSPWLLVACYSLPLLLLVINSFETLKELANISRTKATELTD